ncbi:MAG: endopeptidase La [Oscillospiraceae bacterium]|nr:endopeptidase La [Oscillospiraceae bacterium]
MIAMRGFSVFPGMQVIFDVERPGDMKALDAAMESDQTVFLVALRDASQQEPEGIDSFYQIGAVCRVRQILRVPGGEEGKAMAEGVSRGYLVRLMAKTPYIRAQVEALEDESSPRSAVKGEALMRQCYGLVEKYGETCGIDVTEILRTITESSDPGYIADYVTQNVYMRSDQKQAVLEELRPVQRIALVNRLLRWELDVLDAEIELNDETARRIRKGQREMYLREQLRSIQTELGEDEFGGDDIEEYRLAVAKRDLPEEVAAKLGKEINRLAKQPYGSAESAVIRSYIDTCLEIPWTAETEENLDAQAVRRALDADHFGLEKIKDRIVEYLSVRALSPEAKGSILCLLGPPGTGKTSIALSIARAMNRKLCRISLGGVHDEAEIRGHRKTYVGAMPGRIMAGIQQAGSKNPVMVLDEIDKLGSDYRGDPAAALLEALDPEQNSQFRDHFLELPFDLSHVFFITTANSADTIPPALLDRMEVLELSSYTDEEKLVIAKRHLLPKQRKKNGLNGNQIRISDGAMRELIAQYTRESGVRKLEQQLATLCRKTAAGIVAGQYKSRYIRAGGLEELLGPAKFKDTKADAAPEVGLVHGLAWTSVGGEMLDAEVGVMPGTGKLELTGNLGDVMKESARAAMTYIRSHAEELGLEPNFYEKKDVHIHFPEGAVPKDGPSAGVTICTGLVSALTGIPVRQDVAMTGEITLRGRVLPIGGLREKTMAALRAGIHTVIIPAENEPDLAEIDQTVRAALNFITASRVEAVLDAALCREADNAV